MTKKPGTLRSASMANVVFSAIWTGVGGAAGAFIVYAAYALITGGELNGAILGIVVAVGWLIGYGIGMLADIPRVIHGYRYLTVDGVEYIYNSRSQENKQLIEGLSLQEATKALEDALRADVAKA